MNLAAILDDLELCYAICEHLDPDWRAHYHADPVLGVMQMALTMPEGLAAAERELRCL